MLAHRTLTRLCRARDNLREADAIPLSIDEVAKDAQLSRFHFIRLFEAVFGETPHQFRTRARLERAKHLLALSDYSVTDVCMEVGFTSLGSFSTLFARRVGTTPSIYRSQIRPLIQVPETLAQGLFPGCLTLMSCLPDYTAIFEKRPGEGRSNSLLAGGHRLTAQEQS